MYALVGVFNQEKVLIGAFSVIVKTDGSFAALVESIVPLPHSCWTRDPGYQNNVTITHGRHILMRQRRSKQGKQGKI